MDIFDIKLYTYPDWVRIAMFGLALLWTTLYALLGFFAPNAKIEWIGIEQATHIKNDDCLAFFVTLINNTDKVVSVTKVRLSFYENELPIGGLSSYDKLNAIITIKQDSTGLFADISGGVPTDVVLHKPYAGINFEEANFGIYEDIGKSKQSKILFLLNSRSKLLNPMINTLRVTLFFSNDTEQSKTLKIK